MRIACLVSEYLEILMKAMKVNEHFSLSKEFQEIVYLCGWFNTAYLLDYRIQYIDLFL